ncbi:restriction endonuclease subunit S [Mycoplasma cottewii]|uniref:Restriction endonuclease subunit S n=1 Tax=Mycoplasma cottewii TaxID=51364 RepID=A0ABY5TXW8_9MOLU|nr:restriction endonuclease subunit S [Mycoplasma cottewii]UWD35219.1 restriction endonuclease subunit S [Mycoplasma cottewii]
MNQCEKLFNYLFLNLENRLNFKPEEIELKAIAKDIVTGKTPATKETENFATKDIPFITIDDLKKSAFINKTNRYISYIGANKQKEKFIPPYSLCVSCIATVGELGFTTMESQTNQQINSIVFDDEKFKFYTYFSLRKIFQNINIKSGNIFSNMSKKEFSELKIIKPNNLLLDKFSEVAESIFKKVENNHLENSQLIDLKNYLLPLLMNGQITID